MIAQEFPEEQSKSQSGSEHDVSTIIVEHACPAAHNRQYLSPSSEYSKAEVASVVVSQSTAVILSSHEYPKGHGSQYS